MRVAGAATRIGDYRPEVADLGLVEIHAVRSIGLLRRHWRALTRFPGVELDCRFRLLVRDGLGPVVNTDTSVDMNVLLDRHVVLELDTHADADKSFLTEALIPWIYES